MAEDADKRSDPGDSGGPSFPAEGSDLERSLWSLGLGPTQEDEAPRRALRTRRRGDARIGRRMLGLVGIVALALVSVIAVGLVVAKTRADDAASQRQAAEYTPPPVATSVPLAGSVVIIGDESTSEAASGVPADQRWPALARDALKTNVTTLAEAGVGYVRRPAGGPTFVQQAAEVPADAQVVVFVGGANDAGASSIAILRAATSAFHAAEARAPGAELVVVGPVVAGRASYEQLETITDALRSSAAIARARWVDPIAADWLPNGANTSGRLSAADERAVARRVRALLDPLLG